MRAHGPNGSDGAARGEPYRTSDSNRYWRQNVLSDRRETRIGCRRASHDHRRRDGMPAGVAQKTFSCVEALIPLLQGATGGNEYGGDTAPHGSETRSPPHLLPLRSNSIVRCSPRLRRCSSATRSAHRRLWPSVQQVGVGHSEPPVKGSRLRSLEPLCPPRMQVPTQKQEAPPPTSEGRAAPSAVGWGSSLTTDTVRI